MNTSAVGTIVCLKNPPHLNFSGKFDQLESWKSCATMMQISWEKQVDLSL